MNRKQRKTLSAVFAEPVLVTINWQALVRLSGGAASIDEKELQGVADREQLRPSYADFENSEFHRRHNFGCEMSTDKVVN